VIELADVFRRFADGYLSAHGAAMPDSHRRAIADILACRTEALGGHLWRCATGRFCPKLVNLWPAARLDELTYATSLGGQTLRKPPSGVIRGRAVKSSEQCGPRTA